jgi:hypothetical protein
MLELENFIYIYCRSIGYPIFTLPPCDSGATVTELGFWHRVRHTKILISNLAKIYLAIRYTAAKFAS